jgi:hypothetical protein
VSTRKKKVVAKVAAVITIRGPSEMTEIGANEVAAWMRRIAKDLLRYRRRMSKVFRARYYY